MLEPTLAGCLIKPLDLKMGHYPPEALPATRPLSRQPHGPLVSPFVARLAFPYSRRVDAYLPAVRGTLTAASS